MDIVVNSWFSEYLEEGTNGDQLKLYKQFLRKFLQTKGYIITIRNGQLDNKLAKLEKKYQNHRNVEYLKRIKYVYSHIYYSRKFKKVETVPLSPVLSTIFETDTHLAKDRFLFEAAIQTDDKTIITTDSRLQESMNGKEGIKILLLQEYIN